MLEKESVGCMKCNILFKSVVVFFGMFDVVCDGLVDIFYIVDGYMLGCFINM